MTYRADIDGLRAIAVLAVLFSHLQVGWLGGGYVGVDMFFVISGYLVFGDLLNRTQEGRIDAAAFYLRRARRLLPNLIAMCFVVLLVGAVLLLPSDLARLPARIAGSLLGFANWLFAYQSGYFQPASDWNPLLHTWTLSVEFQFYLVVPLLVLAVARHGRGAMGWAVALLAAASFTYAMLSRDAQDAWHFYDTFARAWEFLIGVVLQLVRLPQIGRRAAGLGSLAALAVLTWSFVFLQRDGSFPDARTLAPTMATAALILLLPGSPVLRGMLSSAPMTLIGRASYSIYIWHWPFVVFAAYVIPGAGEHLLFPVLLVPPILLISLLMHRYCEEPLRRPQPVSAHRFAVMTGGALATLAALLVPVVASNGWPGRFGESIVALDREANFVGSRRERCHRDTLALPLERSCVFGAHAQPTIAIWSDSHGVELSEALSTGLAKKGKAAVLYSFSSCPARQPREIRSDCDRFNVKVLEYLVNSTAIDTVIIAGAIDAASYRADRHWAGEFTAAARALRRAGKRLVVVYPVPHQPFHVPRAMANALRFGFDYDDARTSRDEYLMRTRDAFATYDRVVAARVYPDRVLCGGGTCRVAAGQDPFYFDDNHLSIRGAQFVAAQTLLTLQ